VKSFPSDLYYDPAFVSSKARAEIITWLSTIYPLWEDRYSAHKPPPSGEKQRRLLRPVYWLGNWQFACLDYYRPPEGVLDRCVRAEPFPPVLLRLIGKVENIARRMFRGKDMPPGWHLNTCLVNFYGRVLSEGKARDTARVGEHRDFEPGPVASLSLGERAMFQFVASGRRGERPAVVFQQWLDEGSLQVFGGDRWKNKFFHRVQRVDRREGHLFPLNVDDFEARRVNFTFRYVPDRHIVPYAKLSQEAARDVKDYMKQLARHSSFFAREMKT
jgi:DNA oxidative demethylase